MFNPQKHYHLVSYLRLPLLVVALVSTGMFVYLLKTEGKTEIKDLPVQEISSHFVIKSTSVGLAMQAAQEAEYALNRIRDELFVNQPEIAERIEVYLWSTDKEYYNAVPHVLAGSAGCSTYVNLHDGKKLWRIDLLDYKPGSRVLAHEITHVMLSSFNEKANESGKKTIPLALHEGIAMVAEGVVYDDYMILAAVSIAKEADSEEDILTRLLEVSRSDEVFNFTTAGEKSDFYARSYSLAAFLRQNLKREGFKEFIGHICNGASIDEAFSLAARLPLDDDMSAVRKNILRGWASHTMANAKLASSLYFQN